jgi:predicted transcriptional regulator
MEVHLSAETEKKLRDLAAVSGRETDDILEDAMTGYLEEVLQIRGTLGNRYDELKNGRVIPIDGNQFFEKLRLREDEMLRKRSQE